MSDLDRDAIRRAVRLAVAYWPNGHLGDCTPREDIHSAFRFLRRHLKSGQPLLSAVGALELDAYRFADM